VTEVCVRIEPVRGVAGRVLLEVTDDSPEGFADLTHAYTLFLESAKKGDPPRPAKPRWNACCRVLPMLGASH
jgi:hypothetical protein